MDILIIMTIIYLTLAIYSIYNLCTDFYADKSYKVTMIAAVSIIFMYFEYMVYRAVI